MQTRKRTKYSFELTEQQMDMGWFENGFTLSRICQCHHENIEDEFPFISDVNRCYIREYIQTLGIEPCHEQYL